MTGFLTLSNLKKSFGDTQVVRDFDLSLARGEFISLLGPSGCGKTTVLRMIAGFEAPTSGSIIVDGKDVTGLPASRRRIGMVFQSYALFPNLTAAENVGFGLRVAGVRRAERDARVAEMLDLIGLPHLGDRYPFQLSGGQQQRVALARALAPRPQLLLLDEPLSALDAKIRVSLRNEIRQIQRDLGITTLFVTHDQEEALSISDRIVVMHQGIADQIGPPHEVYTRPATDFVANFVGTLNRLPVTVLDAARGVVDLAGMQMVLNRPLPDGSLTAQIGARPEALNPVAQGGIPVTVAAVEYLGAVQRTRGRLGDGTEVVFDSLSRGNTAPPAPGDVVRLALDPADVILLGDAAA
ncbi:MAG: ABC transporter ATP-binding protein [Paracoccus sp. (in: a-proteobacteria)]|uniref:ABC transporter ATP-binding protein n=1 Tax=Paracoccus sp. TaxID=267 RepID=UPI0026DFB3CB|nr:ABC transporter ATP-binding protein [Paracoccus sp. (in: a-proteobacteria)]MDO5614247.1 ABC transporter ATP-binding protein [Paracoccus sp. (in: a-proteobacteria)]